MGGGGRQIPDPTGRTLRQASEDRHQNPPPTAPHEGRGKGKFGVPEREEGQRYFLLWEVLLRPTVGGREETKNLVGVGLPIIQWGKGGASPRFCVPGEEGPVRTTGAIVRSNGKGKGRGWLERIVRRGAFATLTCR